MLSAFIITKNEEKNIKYCLKSIRSVVDEIIIVDSYSTDRTIQVASNYTKKIYFKRFNNNFAEQRNYALNKCKGDWVLSIDADEILSQSLKKIIPNLINNSKLKGYLIPRRNYINKKTWLKHGLFYPDYQLRLFRKLKVRYINKVHEFPIINRKYLKKIKQYLIHNPSKTKYDKFSSILRLNKFIQIRSEELTIKNYSTSYYLFNGIYLFCKYFIDSFIIGKGFLDGWKGFRAAVIFSSYPLFSSLRVIIKRFNKLKKSILDRC